MQKMDEIKKRLSEPSSWNAIILAALAQAAISFPQYAPVIGIVSTVLGVAGVAMPDKQHPQPTIQPMD